MSVSEKPSGSSLENPGPGFLMTGDRSDAEDDVLSLLFKDRMSVSEKPSGSSLENDGSANDHKLSTQLEKSNIWSYVSIYRNLIILFFISILVVATMYTGVAKKLMLTLMINRSSRGEFSATKNQSSRGEFSATKNQETAMLAMEKAELVNSFYNGDDWRGYRLGDSVRYHSRKFKNGTIDCIINRYFDKWDEKYGNNKTRTTPHVDYECLLESVAEIGTAKNYTKVTDVTLLAFLRLGDVHTYKKWEMDKYIKQKAHDIGFYARKHKLLIVELVSGIHIPDHNQSTIRKQNVVNTERSVEAMLSIRSTLKGVKTNIRVGRPPDEDFFYCASAKHFLPDTGGFNSLCKEMNTRWNHLHP